MDKSELATIGDWKPSANVHDVQVFLGFPNFYRRFIEKYSHHAGPLFDLLKETEKFQWTEKAQKSFESLKTMFPTTPILQHFDPDLETIVETDAFNYVVSGILSQYYVTETGKRLHPVAFYSRRMTPAE